MPYTPFHLGPGLLLKAGAVRHVSFLAFATTQLAIDLESWYFLTRGTWPVHRALHTVLGATLAGVVASPGWRGFSTRSWWETAADEVTYGHG